MYVVCITGASGAILGIRLIENLLNSDKKVSAIVSKNGWSTIRHELQIGKDITSLKDLIFQKSTNKHHQKNYFEYSNTDYFSYIASGSSKYEAVIIVPCSMKTLSSIAHGFSDSLISRAADIALKQNRKLILVPRESPLNLIHLENMLKVKRSGGDILLPVLEFYTHPKTLNDIINFIIGRILDLLNIENDLYKRWGTF